MTQNNKNTASPYYLLYPLLLLLLLTVETYVIVHQTHTSHGASQHLQKITNNPTNMTLSLKIKLAGVGNDGNISPKHHVRKITTLIYGTATSPLAAATTFVTYNGNNYFTGKVRLDKLKQGQYLIKIFSNNMIQEGQTHVQTLLGDKITFLLPITLYPGDLNADNVLGSTDYHLIQSCLQTNTCLLTDKIDFNDDGRTNIKDYNLFLQNFALLHNN